MNGRGPTLFRGVDRASFAAAFAIALRDAGIPVTTATMERFARALQADPPRSKSEMYWVGRVCLVHDSRDFERYDQTFGAIFADAELPTAPGRRDATAPTAILTTGTTMRRSVADGFELAKQRMVTSSSTTVVTDVDNEPDDDHGTVLPEYLPADIRQLAERPFDELDEEQFARIGAWIAERKWRWPTRSVRRTRPATSGSIDLRSTLRRAARTGGVPLTLCHRSPRRAPRRVVALVDTSASMERYATMYLHLVRAFVRTGDAEAFCFSTTLARVTPALTRRDPAEVIATINDTVSDRFSGTRIASSLAELLGHRVWKELPRSAIVLIVSDGWDADPTELLDRQLGRLHRKAHRVLWVNPRAGDERWEPALPSAQALAAHTDALVPGHSLASLIEVIDTLVDA